jgi:hypothetical protein
MFLSKIWFILIAIVCAMAATFALIAPRPFERRLGALEGQRLDRAQYAAEQMFKVDAHKWIDHVGKLGRDAILAESLDAASRGSGESTVIHRTIQDRFRTLIPDLASGGIDSIVAIDTKGRVIARVGDNEKEYGDNMVGAEIIADALRGYLSDDVWGVGGRLQRLAAAPVLSKSRDRIVGAVYVSAETGPALVERLKKNLDVDIALLLRGKVIASSRGASAELDALPELITHHTKEIETAKRTQPISMTVGKEELIVVAAPFPGQAGEQQAYYALIGQHPANSGIAALFANATSDDLKWGQFPWLQLGVAVIAMIAIGLFLQRVEVEAPLRRLRRELQKLASGDVHKIHDSSYGGNVGGLARDVNAAIERFTHAPSQRSDIAGKDLNAILGPSGGSTFDLPATDSAFGGGEPAPAFSPPPPPSFSSAVAPPPPPAPFSAPPLPSFAPPPTPTFAAPQPFNAASLGFGGGSSSSSSTAATVVNDLPLPGATRPSAWGSSPSAAVYDDQTRQDNVNPDGDATRVVPYDEQEEEEAHFRHIFDDFLAKKRDCGESTAGLTRDKFLQKLRDNKASLVAKHNCRTVRFSVYIKDGKAALKATPIRE